jgi:hypothetical protein
LTFNFKDDKFNFMHSTDVHLDPRLGKILANIASYPAFYRACYQDLNQCRRALTYTLYRYALEVLLGLAWMEKNSDVLAKISKENDRNRKITEELSLVAEPGLLPGNTEDEIKRAVAWRVDEFKQAYLYDKKRENQAAFFGQGFLGPPCFNGRLITLKEYIERYQLGSSTYAYQQKEDYDAEACQLEEILYHFMDENEQDTLPTSDQISIYLNGEGLSAHPHFVAIYNRAAEFVKLNYI